MRLCISKRDALCFVLLLAPLEPRYFEINSFIHRFYTLILFASAGYLLAYYIRSRTKPHWVVLLILMLQAWILFSTIYNHGLVTATIFKFLKFSVLCLTIDYYCNDLSRLLRCLMLHFELYVYSNFISYLLFPAGLITRRSEGYLGSVATEWILGWHHYFKVWFIPALLVAWLYRDYFNKSQRCYMLTFIILITESFWGASTGLTGVVLYLLLLMTPWIKKLITPGRAITIATFLIITVVFLQSYEYLSFLLSGIFEDNIDFSGRLVIWQSAINAFITSPIIGYGVRSGTIDVAQILGLGSYASHCHNHILQIMFEGGSVALIVFIMIILTNVKSCVYRWKTARTNAGKICLYAIFVYLIIGITEQYEYIPMYLILSLPYYCCYYLNKKDEKLIP